MSNYIFLYITTFMDCSVDDIFLITQSTATRQLEDPHQRMPIILVSVPIPTHYIYRPDYSPESVPYLNN